MGSSLVSFEADAQRREDRYPRIGSATRQICVSAFELDSVEGGLQEMDGAVVIELRFLPQATEFIVKMFH